jgi:hypothetical protein
MSTRAHIIAAYYAVDAAYAAYHAARAAESADDAAADAADCYVAARAAQCRIIREEIPNPFKSAEEVKS